MMVQHLSFSDLHSILVAPERAFNYVQRSVQPGWSAVHRTLTVETFFNFKKLFCESNAPSIRAAF
jgi:hypothetical protein